MHKTIKIFGLLLIAMGLSSCIELIEEIKINPDLSGHYHLYLENNSLGLLFNALPLNLDIEKFEMDLQKLRKQKGISNFSTVILPKKGQFSIRFDFSDDKSLTRALYASFDAKKRYYNKSFLKVNKRKIIRPNLAPYLIKYLETNDLLSEIPKDVLLDNVTYHYRLISQKDIKSTMPQATSLLLNQREYNQIYPLKEILLLDRSTKSVVHLKK